MAALRTSAASTISGVRIGAMIPAVRGQKAAADAPAAPQGVADAPAPPLGAAGPRESSLMGAEVTLTLPPHATRAAAPAPRQPVATKSAVAVVNRK